MSLPHWSYVAMLAFCLAGTLPLVPYYPPGDTALAEAVAARAETSHAVLLANHGPVVAGKTLKDMGYADVRNLGGFKDWVEGGGEVENA